MENVNNTNKGIVEANDPIHYKIIVVGIIVGITGILLRFATDWVYIDIVSNIIFVIGIFICIKAVLSILK